MDSIDKADVIPEETVNTLAHLLWGSNVSPDVYQRWNQGFVFGTDEPTALLQFDGGPCAVIVPVQAYLLKNLLYCSVSPSENWRHISGCERDKVLCEALADILCQVSEHSNGVLFLCHLSADYVCSPGDTMPPSDAAADTAVTCPKRQRLSHEEFQSALRFKKFSCRNELIIDLLNQLNSLSGNFGLLQFLYAVLLTKGIDELKIEMVDTSEPLIDCVHGHGSQSLINLLLTGTATSHVWDNEKNVSGLRLQGISSRSEVGFLTLLEHLRYCEVGWFLKNPKYPIWLLGSETHLTLLFSQERALVTDEGQEAVVRRMFNRFDEEGRGFISVESLGDLMGMLDLVSDPEYVKLMAEKLDPEQLGVITLNSFMDEFFADLSESTDHTVQAFTVYHYNGLQRSVAKKVVYAEGQCTIPEIPELQMMSDYSPIKTCLLTKWPTIELSWNDGVTPSVI